MKSDWLTAVCRAVLQVDVRITQPRHLLWVLVLSFLAAGCAGVSRPSTANTPPRSSIKPVTHTRFLPPPLTDDWSKWIVGEWEGTGESDTGKGRGTARFELALGGQFLICRSRAEITGLNPDYLKKYMHASDEEIARFQSTGYESLEIYTLDQETGEVVGFLFDNLRCLAEGRGKREGFKETMDWQWRTGHRSTRITERAGDDRMMVIEQTLNPDGTVMEDRGEMIRNKRAPLQTDE